MTERIRPEGSSQQPDPMKKLAALREDYARKLPAKLQQVTDLWNKCCYFNWSTEALVILHNLVHSLAGGGKTFGFPALSDAAKKLEDQLVSVVQSPHAPDDKKKSHISQLVAALPASLKAEPTAVDEPTTAESTKPEVEVQRAQQKIWVVDDDSHMANYLASQLQISGFAVQPCNHLAELFAGIEQPVTRWVPGLRGISAVASDFLSSRDTYTSMYVVLHVVSGFFSFLVQKLWAATCLLMKVGRPSRHSRSQAGMAQASFSTSGLTFSIPARDICPSRQLLLDSCSRRGSTSSIHGVVHCPRSLFPTRLYLAHPWWSPVQHPWPIRHIAIYGQSSLLPTGNDFVPN